MAAELVENHSSAASPQERKENSDRDLLLVRCAYEKEKSISKVSDISVGRSDYSIGDFAEDVKRTCAREGVDFDNDTFNELVG